MTDSEIDAMEAGQLGEAVCSELETPPEITARDARAATRDFQWVSRYYFYSPLGWWVAEIGTDHGPPEADRDNVEWMPVQELSTQIEKTWLVVDKMIELGFDFELNTHGVSDAFAKFVKYNAPEKWSSADNVCVAILRAALKAMMHAKPESPVKA